MPKDSKQKSTPPKGYSASPRILRLSSYGHHPRSHRERHHNTGLHDQESYISIQLYLARAPATHCPVIVFIGFRIRTSSSSFVELKHSLWRNTCVKTGQPKSDPASCPRTDFAFLPQPMYPLKIKPSKSKCLVITPITAITTFLIIPVASYPLGQVAQLTTQRFARYTCTLNPCPSLAAACPHSYPKTSPRPSKSIEAESPPCLSPAVVRRKCPSGSESIKSALRAPRG